MDDFNRNINDIELGLDTENFDDAWNSQEINLSVEEDFYSKKSD